MLTWQAHSGAVTSLAFVPGGGLLSTGTSGLLKYWDLATGAELFSDKVCESVSLPDQTDVVRVLADAAGRSAVVGLRSRGLEFVRLPGGAVDRTVRFQQVFALAAGPDGVSFFVAARGYSSPEPTPDFDHPTRVWQFAFEDGDLLARSVSPPSGAMNGLAVSPDGTQVIAGRNRFAWPSGKIAGPLSLATGCQFAVSPDGDKLFGVNGTRLVAWGLQTGALRQKLKGHVDRITGLTTTPDGRKLWTASADATVRQWDVESYRCTRCYGLKVGPLGCVAVSPDGLTAAAGSAHNGHIAVWDLD
jgi:hypothetical protein